PPARWARPRAAVRLPEALRRTPEPGATRGVTRPHASARARSTPSSRPLVRPGTQRRRASRTLRTPARRPLGRPDRPAARPGGGASPHRRGRAPPRDARVLLVEFWPEQSE